MGADRGMLPRFGNDSVTEAKGVECVMSRTFRFAAQGMEKPCLQRRSRQPRQ
jgi:hypothetical protein